MITRKRDDVPQPKSFVRQSRKALDAMRRFSRIEKRQRGQLRFSFDPSPWEDEELRTALLELFERKCAYCESALDESSMVVDRFRPEQEAMNLDGRIDDPDLYWWLAYEWANLYPSCTDCRAAKATRFPVTGSRAGAEARGDDLRSERRLLLDPCEAGDRPEAELRFTASGKVTALSDRAAATIDVLALNRADLVSRRRDVADELRAQLRGLTPDQIRSQLESFAPTSAPYTALRRALVQAKLEPPASIAAAKKVEPTARTPVWLRHVEIQNFRSLRRLELAFPEHTERTPWLVLLGVNGVGKSSVLQAIALTFMTAADRRLYIPDASALVTRKTPEPGGRVTLGFSDGSTATLRFDRASKDFSTEGRPPPINAYAYGSTRLPPAVGDRRTDKPHLQRLRNLFDPRYPLSLAEKWMASTDHVPSRNFTFLASSLRHLLELDDEDRLVRSNGSLRIRQDGVELPLSEYSDGYRSMVAFTTDLMLNLSGRWDSIATAEGLVLVDELEVHLHPTWRMTAIDRLRAVFPRLRFIATTHDPLCLRGSLPGEVHVLVRDEETRIVEVRQRDVPPGLTADELLTGGWFGMATTLDEDTTSLMLEHSRLLLERETKERAARRSQIEEQLRERRGTFAETGDERLVRSVLAELRGPQVGLSEEQRKSARDKILARVRADEGAQP